MTETVLGIIGGSGIYALPGLENSSEVVAHSPWGKPSAPLITGEIAGLKLVFLARHGSGHTLSPTDINYRANIDILKRAGVTDIVSFSACGSFREDLAPGTFVFVDQFIDRTFARAKSFFGPGCVAHVSMAHPVCSKMGDHLEAAAKLEEIPCQRGGTYLAMEGPQFSTIAESRLYRDWGCDVIGMTNMPEAKLAREAEICYATVAMVTDYDSWHADLGSVDINAILKVLAENGKRVEKIVTRLASDFPRRRALCPQGADRALDHAILTAPAHRDP
ncbi:MAG: S-methyl-5'-thioadenosine phosphorylase, partial [Alphaproteobacteria bacterium]